MADTLERQATALREAFRVLRLAEMRLRSAALGYHAGSGTSDEILLAADAYGSAARAYRHMEREIIDADVGITYTHEEAETVR